MLIPLPFVTALVSALLGMRLALARAVPVQARVAFAALAAISTIGSSLVGIRFGYGVEWLAAYHRAVPFFIGPSLYLGFAAMCAPLGRVAWLHTAVAALSAVVFSVWVAALDVAIACSYATYWVLLFRQHRSGPDGLALLPTELTEQMHRWRRGALVLFAAVFLLENAVALSFAAGLGAFVPSLISLGSLPIVAVLLVAALNAPSQRPAPQGAADADGDISDIKSYLTQTQAFRDPDLSLAKLARGLGQPIKSVSRRINQATGQSVSLYVNSWRVQAAAAQLNATKDKVEVVGQDCGFLSRSNFYREFQRVYGVSPAAYRGSDTAQKPL